MPLGRRENGITHRLTAPRTPTTTGKIERFHGSLRRELLDSHPPFNSLAHAQTVIDTWVTGCNTDRPHQALDMTAPVDRFSTTAPEHSVGELALVLVLVLKTEIEFTADDPIDIDIDAVSESKITPILRTLPNPLTTRAAALLRGARPAAPPTHVPAAPVTVERIVSSSGSIMIARQRIQIGRNHARAVVTATVDEDTITVHHGPHLLIRTPRTNTTPVTRHRASNH
ncbi:integrase core domain-containing protein [Nocardia sp. CNY236]|uniref:integrase core domain-containing protein n=1 Tax=Nocardia sp. CNY236 TaxID=1169152 RepID=UPI00041D01FE